ncbi:Uncharacterised protein [Mycobacteroides abscessus]|nr:Uncharacterised protein [Mycobacteroides abscessus]
MRRPALNIDNSRYTENLQSRSPAYTAKWGDLPYEMSGRWSTSSCAPPTRVDQNFPQNCLPLPFA